VVETLRDADAAALVAEVGAALDEPVADSSLIPTWALSRLARRHVTVALSGDGGDELFCGYPTFLVTAALAGPLGAVASAAARSALGDGLRALPFGEGTGYMGWAFRAQRLLRGLGHDPATRDVAFLGPLDEAALRELLGGGIDTHSLGEALYEGPRALYDETAGWHPVDRAAAFYIRFYLAESVLPKVDRMSMAHALEVRAPFLSNEMVALASRIPWRMKLLGVTTKAVLRDAAAPLLPRGLAMRPKHGFAAPVALWTRQGRLPIRWASLEARLATTLPPGAIAALRARAASERGLATALWALGAAG
jgi:asparagine synthase (glutamine-hydrolysing)